MAKKSNLSKKELQKLQESVGKSNQIRQNQAQLCLEKELETKRINNAFNENWEVMELNMDQAQRDQQQIMAELTLKYGKGKLFDLDTGAVKDQE